MELRSKNQENVHVNFTFNFCEENSHIQERRFFNPNVFSNNTPPVMIGLLSARKSEASVSLNEEGSREGSRKAARREIASAVFEKTSILPEDSFKTYVGGETVAHYLQ